MSIKWGFCRRQKINATATVTLDHDPADNTETKDVTTCYDNTTIVLPNGKNYTTVTLAPAESTTILFTWNTTGVSLDFYTIEAKASKVPG